MYRPEGPRVSLRATWKGYLKLGEVVCAVSLYTAISTSERVSLHMVDRRTGHRLQRRFVDAETGEPVEREDQAKGYEVSSGAYVMLDPEEVARAIPQGDRTLAIDRFIACEEVDDLYFDRPYYLRPADEVSQTAFAVIREGLRRRKVVALATGVLFRRPRTLLIRAYDEGIVATTLNFDYEVRAADDAFDGIKAVTIDREMLDLARHIIATKAGAFRPESFDDTYDAALAALVRAKMEGRTIKPQRPAAGKVVDLREALRQSAALAGKEGKAAARGGTSAPGKTAPGKTAPGKTAAGKTAAGKSTAGKAPAGKRAGKRAAKRAARPSPAGASGRKAG